MSPRSTLLFAVLAASCGGADVPPPSVAHVTSARATEAPTPAEARWRIDVLGRALLGVGIDPSGGEPSLAAWLDGYGFVTLGADGSVATLCTGTPSLDAARIAVRGGRVAFASVTSGRLALGPPADAIQACDTAPGPAIDGADYGIALDDRGGVHACHRAPDGSLRYSSAGVEETLAQDGRECDLAVDREGRPHVVWREAEGLVVARRADGGWAREAIGDGRAPRIAVGEGSVAVLAYDEEGAAWSLSRAEGGWSRDRVPFTALAPAGLRRSAVVAALALYDRTPHAVQASDDRVEHAFRDEAGWHVELVDRLSPPHHAHVPRVALGLDATGEPIVAYMRDASEARVARRIAPGSCAPEETVRDEGLCCFEGQRAEDGRCAGEARCPEGYVADASGCTALAPEVRYDAALCARGPLGYGGPLTPSAASSCERLAGDALAIGYAVQRCNGGSAPHCYAAAVIESGRAAVDFEAFVAIVGPPTPLRTTRRTELRTTPGEERSSAAVHWLESACRAGVAPACVILGVEASDVSSHAAACNAGVLASCAVLIDELELGSAEHTAALERVREPCRAGRRTACAYAAHGEARAGTAAALEAARAALDRACGRDDELPRIEDASDDPATFEDDRVEELSRWADDDVERVHACSALVRLAQATSSRVDRRSAARTVLRAACASGEAGVGMPCTSLAIALGRGLGGPRDLRGAEAARELAGPLETED